MLDPRGIFVYLDEHVFESFGLPSNFGSAWNLCIFGRSFFLNLWDFQVVLDPRGILVFLDDQMFESLGFPSNFGSAWNLGIFGRSIF